MSEQHRVTRIFTADQLERLNVPDGSLITDYENEYQWYSIKEAVFLFEKKYYSVKFRKYKFDEEIADMSIWTGKLETTKNVNVVATEVTPVAQFVIKYVPV